MMRGEYAEIKRFAFGSVLAISALYLIKPGFQFKPDGSMRPWSLMTTGTDLEKESTPVPIWLLGLGLGAIPALFI